MTRKILVVDDETDIRAEFAEYVQGKGYEVEVVFTDSPDLDSHVKEGGLRMCRIAFAAWLVSVFLVFPAARPVAEDLPRIVLLETMTLVPVQQLTEGLLAQMAEMGFADGRGVRIERLNAEKDRDRARDLLQAALSKGRPSLVLTNATIASQVAYEMLRGTDIPLMFFGVSEPVRAGLIKAVGEPTGENITGMAHGLPESTVIRMVVKVLTAGSATRPFRIGVLYSTYPSSTSAFAVMEEVDKKRSDVSFIPLLIQQLPMDDGMAEMIERTRTAIDEAKEKMDYLWLARGPLGSSKEYVQAVLEASPVPLIFGRNMETVRQGALMMVGTDRVADGREAGRMAVKLIEGADPSTLAVGKSDKFMIGINLSTADRMGIVVPSDIIGLAQDNLVR